MYWVKLVSDFDFDDNAVLNEQINVITVADFYSVVNNVDGSLAYNCQADFCNLDG